MGSCAEMFDLKLLLNPVSEENPSGPNLEYDAAYTALSRATQGKPEQELGETLVSAEPPKWDEVQQQALDLFPRTKDLRVTTWLLSALLHTDGLFGLREGLHLLRELLAVYWQNIHPQLDPDDKNDPTERINILMLLTDPQLMLLSVRETPLVYSKVFGRFNLKDILLASRSEHTKARPGGQVSEMATINAAFTDASMEAIQGTSDAVSGCIDCMQDIEAFVAEKVGVKYAPNFKDFLELLKEIGKVLSDQLRRHGVKEEVSTEETQVNAPSLSAQPSLPAVPDQITSREDVFRVLDQVINYYTKYEPSSPVPLLLKRSKQLIYKDFMEILNDLVPTGVAQAKVICGPQTKE